MSEPTRRARLVVLDGAEAGRAFELCETVTLGRDAGCDVYLSEGSVSRRHARVAWDAGVWRVRDLGSRNGLHKDGRRCAEAPLADGDVFRLGQVRLRFEAAAPDAPRGRRGAPGDVVLEEEIDLAALVPPAERAPTARVAPVARRQPARGLLGRDLTQYPGWVQLAIVLAFLALAGGLAWAAFRAVTALRARL